MCTPARAPTSRPTLAAGELGISIGTVCGETLRAPFSFSTSYWSSRVVTPPMPEAITAPRRSGASLEDSSVAGVSKPASAQASRAAISANCAERSSLRASGRGRISPGSTAVRAAIRTGSSAAHSSVRTATPERPASRFSQVVAASPPSGVKAPIPVTTTVRFSTVTGSSSLTFVRGVGGGPNVGPAGRPVGVPAGGSADPVESADLRHRRSRRLRRW